MKINIKTKQANKFRALQLSFFLGRDVSLKPTVFSFNTIDASYSFLFLHTLRNAIARSKNSSSSFKPGIDWKSTITSRILQPSKSLFAKVESLLLYMLSRNYCCNATS